MTLSSKEQKALKFFWQKRLKLSTPNIDARTGIDKNQIDYLTEQHIVRESHPHYPRLLVAAHEANNVYNQGLYRVRQALFKHQWLSCQDLWKSFKASADQRDSMIKNKIGNANVTQQILKVVAHNMTAWNQARKAYQRNSHRFTGYPRLPKYRTKGGLFTLYISNQTAKLRANGVVEIPFLDHFKIKLQHTETSKLQIVRIVPKHHHFLVEVVYQTSHKISYKPDNHRYLGIDPGVNNAFSLISNVKDFQPLIINGRPLKSVNHFYNKRRSQLYSIQAQLHQPHQSRQLSRLEFYRYLKITRFAHEASKRIVDIALSHALNTIVIGKNKQWKTNLNLDKKTNQNFVGIPHQSMINMIKYKANLAGIVVIEQNESYTSQTSFLDHERPVNANGNQARKRKGLSPHNRRLKRGLFKSNHDILINADINGAYQILRKAVPNAYVEGIQGSGLTPVKVNLNF
ncbi:RNA-guided endonuclease InsQ/TnpB family protein [Loigolactobacillus bifermentans]|nr:RNA-guided endonuclease TnpB family protein [Loigolactobacillus bifermentans]